MTNTDTQRLEWLFNPLNDNAITKKINEVARIYVYEGHMRGIHIGDWRSAMDAAMELEQK